MRRAFFPFAALWLASMASPAAAGQSWRFHHPVDWWWTHEVIYDLQNRIALLEANPETDDGYRAPIITRDRAAVRRLHATLGPAEWRWTTPCCYSRRPIHIRWASHRGGSH